MDIDNSYDCNVNSLRVCCLDDKTSLFGCKELLDKCVHFNTQYEDGVIIIPKNKNPNEGYAPAVNNINHACNIYHGDFMLVTTSQNYSNDYRFICKCKYDGYIGN